MTNNHMPLSGIRVLDMTNVLAGPFCCHHLAHLGAEVIKIEAVRRGDLARQLGADPDLNRANMGVSFLAQNAGKKSVTIDLKKLEGKSIFLKLVQSADVVVENFRPGVMKRLGLEYDVLKAAKPELIYCAISGFGQDGPWVARPAYDQIIQGLSGAMSITGDAKSAPLRVGYPVADTMGGMTAAFAIAAALNKEERGCFIDVSMLESVLSSMGWVVSNHLIAGIEPSCNGNENPTSAPSGTFETRQGLINIAANKDEQWTLLTDYLGLSHLQSSHSYRTREARKENRKALKAELETVLRKKPATHWAEELNSIGVPAGAVLTVPEILETPQITGRGFLDKHQNVPGVGRDIQLATTGIQLDGVSPTVSAPPPILGEHNDDILGQLGLSADDLDQLRKDGVI
ncbi:MAG: CaiB/BaiF CoA-transferase family protein [Pseudomonadota bacterium]